MEKSRERSPWECAEDRRVRVRSILRHLFVHGLSSTPAHCTIIRYLGPLGSFQNFKEEQCGCQRPRMRKNLFSSPTRLGGKEPNDVWGASKRVKKKQTTTAVNCSSQPMIPSLLIRAAPSLPLFRLGWDLTDDADETSCTPNRGSARSDVRSECEG